MTKSKLYQAVELFEEVLFVGTEVIHRELSHNLFEHVSRQQFDLLNSLMIKGPSSPGSLAVLQGVHKSAISNRIKKLLEKGLVEWDTNELESDKRSKLIKITAEGKKVINDGNAACFSIIENLFDDVEEEKIDTFIEILTMAKEKLTTKGESKE
ncbi:MarR family winged helix-turn-helix transcriptional regulator [Priestia megaterium]|uniref:MarR family winged helix-turn-helix transcriptional regulator n=1 Tax=Priestia megaterium TaxID=1404 RepID=UPI000BFA76A2|nr:MarR family transcriptional regulator [Priestia megaterium]PFE01883.1 MarR family transcriptional regulator [Priestia megaterium]TJZ40457.1 MarR family transcriptional regulator [Priestia megaterium]